MTTSPDLRAAILEAQVDAALAGHDIGEFKPVSTHTPGYQARCRRCDRTVWVGLEGLLYSLLGDSCPGRVG